LLAEKLFRNLAKDNREGLNRVLPWCCPSGSTRPTHRDCSSDAIAQTTTEQRLLFLYQHV